MSETTPDRDEEMLACLAEFDLAAAGRVHGRLMAAEESGELAELGRTYQRIARSLRQTLALKAKLRRDREAAAQAAERTPPPRKPPGGMAVARRIRELRDAVTRIIWTEAERAEAPDFADDANYTEEALEDLITREMRGDGFCDEALDDHVARICISLRLSPEKALRWRELPDPPESEPPEPEPPEPEPPEPDATPDRRSSG